jgi:alkylation response protein AidB-like acyl-CoA dehydrogenase
MDGEDRQLFERSVRHATERHTGAALDTVLEELGWRDALTVDPRTAVSVLFEAQGSANATSSAIEHLVLHALGLSSATCGIVLPALDRTSPPAQLDGSQLSVSGMATAALPTHDDTLLVATTDSKDVAIVVPTRELALRPVTGLDPRLDLIEVRGEAIAIDSTTQPATGWETAVSLAQLAIGHELVGAARQMLALARDHALERVQFGQPIARFQVIRHRLADTLVAIETADAMLDAAWLDQLPHTAAMAKALAGRGARTAARHCQQVLAGIGFTTEHPLHNHIRRTLVLDELFGSARSLTKDLGDHLITTRQLPPLLSL